MPPNILFFTCHDLGRHLNCYGHQTVNSPALDALAADGVLFADMFCTSPQCSPSRAALHTGRYPHSNGVMGLTHDDFNWRLNPGEKHMAHYLKEAGYHTALAGIQHLTDTPADLGYDTVLPLQGAPVMARDVVDLLKSDPFAEGPFYLEIGFVEPHRPFDMNGATPDDSKGVDLPPYVPDTAEAREDFAALQGMIKMMDDGIKIILDALDEAGLRENTWVVFAADHGLPMPRAKCTLYDPGIEVAFIMRWPDGGLSGGQEINAMLSYVDVVPTMLEALDLPVPDTLQGRSLWPLLQGERYAERQEIFLEKTYHTAYEPMRGIRTATYKYIINFEVDIAINVPSDIQKSPIYPQMIEQIVAHRPHIELYDLQADPNEQENLAGQPEVAGIEQELRHRLLAWMRETNDPLLNGPVPSPYYRQSLEQVQQ